MRCHKTVWVTLFAAACFLLSSCKRESGSGSMGPNNGSLFFHIEETGSTQTDAATVKTWSAIYDVDDKTGKFNIELTLTKSKGDVPMAFGKGAFRHDSASDSSKLLQDLAVLLEAKNLTPPQNKTNTLNFPTAVLGVNLSRGQGKDVLAGTFTSDPKGDWISVKLFVTDGDKDGEVYLNLNSKTGQGEFAIKDPDYGDTVWHELARVL
jgi:hypothetical protein